MGFFKKFFGGGRSIDGLRKAVAQQRYVDARYLAEQLSTQPLEEGESAEVEELRIAAGDGLARLNLDEALGLQSCGDYSQAADHLRLAQEQVCSAGLRKDIEQALAAEPLEAEIHVAETDKARSCSSCSTQATTVLTDDEAWFGDAESQLELVLTSYPAALAPRYEAKGEPFKEAFLMSHAGQDDLALSLWLQVDAADQDDLYDFELGALYARKGDLEQGRSMLESALEKNPELLLAIEALVPVLVANGDYPLAEERLQQFLQRGIDPSFCYAQLTNLHVQQQQLDIAADYARKALEAGTTDHRFILLAASVFEETGALTDAEKVFKLLPASGCKGGVSLPLAEFWLRYNRELSIVLDTFNAACRQEPDNPRWQLRVAQTYFAKNWVKDGLKILRKVVNDPRMEADLVAEAEGLLVKYHG
ncbi:hypothetical protein SAMN05660420_01034 [Desulfuromusa kysingii]|uniref:Uncharacterized protein n=1 Tax=Desulfuromusa kysingii TaxID=37625 RepID=A0A1H3XLZ3_9BACT|nr:hypothetical protein [Desulfuromusa kysingii]SEA00447.1 hypothetical protein SAMN05660420_01034 [Desulfuromusa kysingii]